MPSVTLPVPQIAFIVGTRAALAAGVALLAADRLSSAQRRKIGLGLIAFGAATTVPAALWVTRAARRSRAALRSRSQGAVRSSADFVGATRYPRKGDEPF